MGFFRQEYWSGVPLPSPRNVHRYVYIHLSDNIYIYVLALEAEGVWKQWHPKAMNTAKSTQISFLTQFSNKRNWDSEEMVGWLTGTGNTRWVWSTLQVQKVFCWLMSSGSVVSDSSWTHGLQHARLPCPSLPPRACSNSCPLSQWCHPTVSSSVVPLFLLLSVFPSIRVFSNELALCIRWPKYVSIQRSHNDGLCQKNTSQLREVSLARATDLSKIM